MSTHVPFTPGTHKQITDAILSPHLTPLQAAMKGKQSNTDLVKVANHMMEEGLWARESTERLSARQKIHNFLVKKLPLKSKVKRILRFQEAGKRKTLHRRRSRRQTRKGKKKILIPPVLVEAGINAAEILAGGARKHTRKY